MAATFPMRPARQSPVPDGRGITIADFAEDPIACLQRLHAENPDLAIVEDAGQRIAFVFSPALNQLVLNDTETFHSRFFAIRGPKRSAQRRLSCGLLAMNGEQHKRNRRLVKEPFGKRMIGTYYDRVVGLVDEMLAAWQPGDVRCLHAEMTRHLLRVTSSILFGLNDAEMAYRIGGMLDRWAQENHRLGIGALVPDETFSRGYEELLQFAAELETEILQLIRRRRSSRKAGNDVLSILVRTHDQEGRLSDEELVGQTAVLFAAAHLTTAHSLTWALFLLAQHPTVMEQLVQELAGTDLAEAARSELGGEKSSCLDRVIKETMRVLPASAYSQRVCNRAATLDGLEMPRGTAVVFSQFISHRREDTYDSPKRFLPDRWETIRPSPYEYLPFGAGPRLCIGGPLAMMIIKTTLPRIVQRFRLTVQPQANICGKVISTMLTPTTKVPVEISEHDGTFQASPIQGNLLDLVDFSDVPTSAGQLSV